MIFLNQIESFLRVAVADQVSGCDHIVLQIKSRNNVVLFETASRKIGDYYEFPGMEESIRGYMLQNNLSVFSSRASYYPLDASGSQLDAYSANLDVLFHSSKLIVPSYRTADEVVDSIFLIPYNSILAVGVSAFTLYYYASTAGTITITRTFVDGTTDTISSMSNSGFGFVVVNRGDCRYAHVEFGYRSADIYFVDSQRLEKFSFRNVFNVLESVSLPAALESNPKTEFETAQQDKVLQRYDIEQQLEMKVQSAELPAGLYNQLYAMCRARDVNYVTQESLPSTVGSVRPVIIKDYKLPKSTEPNTPITFEMTFSYCDTELNDAVVLG